MEISSNLRRKRVRRRITRRFSVVLGLFVAMCPASVSARDRTASSPRRVSTEAPPWSGSGGYSPPHPLDSTGGPSEARVHPAIHRSDGHFAGRLFPRAGKTQTDPTAPDRERTDAMLRHPAGKAIASNTGGRRFVDDRVTVKRGDSLWSLAEARVGLNQAPKCWPSIYRHNHRTIGEDPAHIEPGQRLTIPRKECG